MAGTARAASFDPQNASGLSQSDLDMILKTVAIGADHRAYRSAENMGITLGIDIGIDVTVVQPSDQFRSALTTISGTDATNTTVFLPRFNFHKGLPGRIDLGFSFISYQTMKVYGLEASWNPIPGNSVGPNVQARLSASYANLWFIQSRTFKLDAVASKALVVFDPYGGLGLQFWNGTLNVPSNVATAFQAAGLSQNASGMGFHIFAGVTFKLVFLKFAAEYDWSSSSTSTIGTKVSIAL